MVKHIESDKTVLVRDTFDTRSLGQWTLIPTIYQAYWSFDNRYAELKGSASPGLSGRKLHDEIESCMDSHNMPAHVHRALDQLRFKAALLAEDTHRICKSTQAAVAGLCLDNSLDPYQGLLELARITGAIEKQYPALTEELLRPLIRKMVKHTENEIPVCLDRLMKTVCLNNWLTYGRLLLEEIHDQGLVDEDALDNLTTQLETRRLARMQEFPVLGELTGTTKQYLAQLDATPPRGTLDINDIRHILKTGLQEHYTGTRSETGCQVTEDVIQSIRLIVGEGPFQGNKGKLADSIERFLKLYIVTEKIKVPMDSMLATLLALSFCDISTSQDHDRLCRQIHELSVKAQSQINTMLHDRGLGTLITQKDVNDIFLSCEQKLRPYVDDPLWPALKFPLSRNEEIVLANKLKLRCVRLEALFEETSLMVRYGGLSQELKQKTMAMIAQVALAIMPEAAFLRRPPFPGITCQYRINHGFTAVMEDQFYKDRPKERFRAMRYFHIGNYLMETVEREKRLMYETGKTVNPLETQ